MDLVLYRYQSPFFLQIVVFAHNMLFFNVKPMLSDNRHQIVNKYPKIDMKFSA